MDKQDKRNIVLGIVIYVMLLLCLGLVGYSIYHKDESTFLDSVDEQLTSVAELKVRELATWRQERLGDASILANNELFQALAQSYLRRPSDAGLARQLRAWLTPVHTFYRYYTIAILDAQGRTRLTVPAAPGHEISATFSRQAGAIIRGGRPVWLDFHRCSPGGPVHLSVAAPLRGSPAGLLVLVIDPRVYLYPYISSWPGASASAESLLVRREGDAALFLNDLRFAKDSALQVKLPLTRTDNPAVCAVQGGLGVMTGNDYRGIAVRAVALRVPDAPWVLMTKMDIAEAYAPLQARRRESLQFFALAALSLAAVLSLIWRHQRVSYYKEKFYALESARRSEEKYLWLFKTMIQGAVYQDAEGKIISANPSAERILGLTLEQMQGMTSMDPHWRTIHEDGSDFPGEQHPAMQALRTGQPVLNTLMGVFNPGYNGWRWIEINAIPLVEPGAPKPYQVYTTFQDITERRLAEEKVRRSEHMMRTFMDSSSDMIFLKDRNFCYLMANAALCGFWGRSEGEIIGKDDFELMDEPHARECRKSDALALQEKKLIISVEVVAGRDYETAKFPVELDSGAVGVGGFIRDITERKQAQEALQERDARLSKLALQVTGMLYQFMRRPDGSYCVPYSSEGIRLVFGCAPGEVAEDFAPIARAILPEDFERVVQSIELSAAQLSKWECEYRVQLPGEPVKWIWGQSLPEPQPDGSLLWHGFVTEITGKKQAEAQLKASNQRMQALLEFYQWEKPAEAEIIAKVNEAIVRFTASELAFVGLLDEHEAVMHAHIWSGKAMERCSLEKFPDAFHIAHAGLWAEAIRRHKVYLLNDFAAPCPDKRGLPPGHVPLTRFLAVPVLRDGKAVMIGAVANKAEPYDDNDAQQMQLFLESVWVRLSKLRMQDSLERNEYRFRQISSTMFDIAYSCLKSPGQAYTLDWISGATERITGYGPEELRSKGCWRFLVFEPNVPLFDRQVTGLAPGESGSCELRLQRKDGAMVWVESYAKCLPDRYNPSNLRIYGALIDITGRKQAEDNIRSQLEELKRWQDVMLDGEDRLQELKREVNRLCRQAGQPIRYPSQENAEPGAEGGMQA